jgi:hypothetical protein
MTDNSKPLNLNQILQIVPKEETVAAVPIQKIEKEEAEKVVVAPVIGKPLTLAQADEDAIKITPPAPVNEKKLETTLADDVVIAGASKDKPLNLKQVLAVAPKYMDAAGNISPIGGGSGVAGSDASGVLTSLEQIKKLPKGLKVVFVSDVFRQGKGIEKGGIGTFEYVPKANQVFVSIKNKQQVFTPQQLIGNLAYFPLKAVVKVSSYAKYKKGDTILYRVSKYSKSPFPLVASFPVSGLYAEQFEKMDSFLKYVTVSTAPAPVTATKNATTAAAKMALPKRMYVEAKNFYVTTPKLGLKRAGYKADVIIDTTMVNKAGGKTYYRLVKLKGNGKWENRVNKDSRQPAYWVLADDWKAYPNQLSAPLNAAGYHDDGDGDFNPSGDVDTAPVVDANQQTDDSGVVFDPQAGVDFSNRIPTSDNTQGLPMQNQVPVYNTPQVQQPDALPLPPNSVPVSQPTTNGTGQELFKNGENVQPYRMLIETTYPVQNPDGSVVNKPFHIGDIIWSDAPFDYNNIAPEHKGSFPDPSDPNGQLQRYAWTSVNGVTTNGGLIPMRKDTIEIINDYQGQGEVLQAEGSANMSGVNTSKYPNQNTGIAGNITNANTSVTKGGAGMVKKPLIIAPSPFTPYPDDKSKLPAESGSKTWMYVGGVVIVAAAAFFAVKHFKPEWLKFGKK